MKKFIETAGEWYVYTTADEHLVVESDNITHVNHPTYERRVGDEITIIFRRVIGRRCSCCNALHQSIEEFIYYHKNLSTHKEELKSLMHAIYNL